uniref:RECA_3 domain-containing protein n=1 Tax=Angiostrongylus costaricensis TaxID=334426 RepID=A0A158PH42_ANGCS
MKSAIRTEEGVDAIAIYRNFWLFLDKSMRHKSKTNKDKYGKDEDNIKRKHKNSTESEISNILSGKYIPEMVVSMQAEKPRAEEQCTDDEDAEIQDVELLQNHGINMADIKKLQSVGICTVKGVMMTTKKRLAEVKGLSEAKVDKIKEAACKIMKNGFITALEVCTRRKQCFKISTGSLEFDKLLGGGIESQSITEVFGEFRTGKTQLHLSITKWQLSWWKIFCTFRVDYSGRGELAERQQKLAQMMSRLQKIAEEYNVAIFISNQMTADPGAGMTFQADPKKPIGGHILAHASTTRIMLKKGRGETRIAKIYDSPDMPENEATFAISNGGIVDAKESLIRFAFGCD